MRVKSRSRLFSFSFRACSDLEQDQQLKRWWRWVWVAFSLNSSSIVNRRYFYTLWAHIYQGCYASQNLDPKVYQSLFWSHRNHLTKMEYSFYNWNFQFYLWVNKFERGERAKERKTRNIMRISTHTNIKFIHLSYIWHEFKHFSPVREVFSTILLTRV